MSATFSPDTATAIAPDFTPERGSRVFCKLGTTSDVVSPVTGDKLTQCYGYVRHEQHIFGAGRAFSVRLELDNGARGPVRVVLAKTTAYVAPPVVADAGHPDDIDADGSAEAFAENAGMYETPDGKAVQGFGFGYDEEE